MQNNLGIHQFKNFQGSSSFFIQRKFGNILMCADLIQELNYEFLKSKGGVYKQMLAKKESINSTHGQLSNRFGASVVLLNATDTNSIK